MTDCVIEAGASLANFRWHRATFENCTFCGTYVGSDFGKRSDEPLPHGDIHACDFADARLVSCSFYGCDVSSLKLPAWPCFTILEPVRRREELVAAEWPGKFSFWADRYREASLEKVAATFYAPDLVQRWGGTEAELKMALDRLGGVRY
jgi:hypothetical protein